MELVLANRQAAASCLDDPLICVCNFHLTGVTNKTIVDMGLKRLVFKSPIFNHHCRMINSLATVPERFVTRAYDKLHKYLDDNLSDALQVLEYWGKHLVKGYIVLETQNHVLPKWKISEWNIYEKIINKHETSTCKLEAWHQRLSKVLMKSHPSFEDFCKSMMGEWTKLDYEMEHLKNGYGRNDLKFNPSVAERKRKERVYTVAMNVNNYSTIVEYLDAMATASKK